MKKAAFFTCLLLLPILPQAAAWNQLAVLDFTVKSEDPAHTSMGKGLSALLALELGKSPGVRVVKRNKRGALLAAGGLSPGDLEEPQTRARKTAGGGGGLRRSHQVNLCRNRSTVRDPAMVEESHYQAIEELANLSADRLPIPAA